MGSHLYRFRSTDRLLGDSAELQEQTIYFARPAELNDPVEGLRDVFWQGDEIIWRNLFRHYLLCLDRACSLLSICGEDHPFDWNAIPVVAFEQPALTAPQSQIIESFLADNVVHSYLQSLAERTTPIRRDELAAHFRALHLFAVCTVYVCYEQHNFVPPHTIKPEIRQQCKAAIAEAARVLPVVKKFEAERAEGERFIEAFYAANKQICEQMDLNNLFSGAVDPSRTNKNFVFLNFPDEYVRQVERLMYPEWYAACFTEDCCNSSLWGHYASNHAGVCLKFRVTINAGRRVIPLSRVTGWGSNGPMHGKIDHEFLRIDYAGKPPPMDFFRSLGRLPMPMLRQFWYSDQSGHRSECGSEVLKGDEEWRKKYWSAFQRNITTKLADWGYEKENRLVLCSSLLDFSDASARMAKYDFADLDAIIFGINTPRAEKIEIRKIVEEKCRASGRRDFKFFQAYYSPRTGKIEHSEMALMAVRR